MKKTNLIIFTATGKYLKTIENVTYDSSKSTFYKDDKKIDIHAKNYVRVEDYEHDMVSCFDDKYKKLTFCVFDKVFSPGYNGYFLNLDEKDPVIEFKTKNRFFKIHLHGDAYKHITVIQE